MERRHADDSGTDRIVRHVWRAAAEQALAASSKLDAHAGDRKKKRGGEGASGHGGGEDASARSNGDGASTSGVGGNGTADDSDGADATAAGVPDDVEEIYQDDRGLVFFDGGTYSLGPSMLGR